MTVEAKTIEPENMDDERRHAWLHSLSADESRVVMVPVGYKHTLLIIAYIKRALVTCEMRAGERLRFLEKLNGLTDIFITPEMLAIIEPMSDAEMAIMHEARSLDREDDKLGSASFKVLTSWKVFNHLLRLNPSLLSAILLREKRDNSGVRMSNTSICEAHT
jgi:hypothetical protein